MANEPTLDQRRAALLAVLGDIAYGLEKQIREATTEAEIDNIGERMSALPQTLTPLRYDAARQVKVQPSGRSTLPMNIINLGEWMIAHWEAFWFAIRASEAAATAWEALLSDHKQKQALIDPASPTSVDETKALNQASYDQAEAWLKQYGRSDAG